MDFSVVGDLTVRKSLARKVIKELEKQHHNCLIQSAYIELQEEMHKTDVLECHKARFETMANYEAILQQQSTSLNQCYQNATWECDHRLLKVTGKNHNVLHEKEMECQSRLALKEAGCRQRIALKEMGCEFAISIKEEECLSKIAEKDIECAISWPPSLDGWEEAVSSVKVGMDERLQGAATRTRTWVAGKMEELFGTAA